MSIEVMTRVWANSQQKGSGLLLLLSIADYANERGVAYPSVETLALKVRMTERNVQKLLRQLETSGELIITPNAGPAGCNLYRIVTDRKGNNRKGGENFSPPTGRSTDKGGENFSGGGERQFTGGVNASSPGGERQFTGGVNASSPEPSSDPSVEPSIEPSIDDDDARTRTAPVRAIATERRKPNGRKHNASVQADAPSPPVAPAPPPAEVAAVAAALLDHGICANDERARADAARLLADHPAEWLIRAASQTADRSDVSNPYAYMVRTVQNWRHEGGPRPARKSSRQEPETEADRRRKYIPDELSDIILG